MAVRYHDVAHLSDFRLSRSRRHFAYMQGIRSMATGGRRQLFFKCQELKEINNLYMDSSRSYSYSYIPASSDHQQCCACRDDDDLLCSLRTTVRTPSLKIKTQNIFFIFSYPRSRILHSVHEIITNMMWKFCQAFKTLIKVTGDIAVYIILKGTARRAYMPFVHFAMLIHFLMPL